MVNRSFLVFISLFFLKFFTINSKTVRLYLVCGTTHYRYFSEKNDDYNNFNNTDDIKELNTDYKIKNNILDLQEIDEKIKNKDIIFKGHKDIYEDKNDIDFNNWRITSLKLLSDIEKKGFSYRFNDVLKENFYEYKIEDLNKKIQIPNDVNFVYIFFEDFSKIDLFKKGTIKHLFITNDNGIYNKNEFTEINDIIKIDDLYNDLKYIEKCDYFRNIQLTELLNNKLLNDDNYKKLEIKFKNLTKKGDEEFKIEDLKKMGFFIYNTWCGNENEKDKHLNFVDLNDEKTLKNENMYLACNFKFKKKVKIIFNIPENTELDLGLSMKQEAEIEFDSFNQESIEEGLKNSINKIFTNKSVLNNGHHFGGNFWQGYEGIWPEKYEVEEENGNKICTILKQSNDNYIDIMDKDNLTFKIYLKPGSEILKGIHVTLHFEPVAGKFVSSQLSKEPKNDNIIGRTDMYGTVFLCKGDNYIEQIKNILKEGYFNKQKISLDDDCYQLCLRKYEGVSPKFIPLTDNNQLDNDVPMIFIRFNDNAINKYIKEREDAPDPVYYGNGKDTGRNKGTFDPNYEYEYNYNYQAVTGDFENYYNYFKRKNSGVKYIGNDDPQEGPVGGNPGINDYHIENDEEKKDLKHIGCCAKCLSKCCCCCNKNRNR